MKIAFIGDIALFDNGMLRNGWENRLGEVREFLSQHDAVIANLEVPVTERRTTLICKGIHLKSNRKVIDVLRFLNISGVCLANNHICDFGLKGMNDTEELLQSAGIGFFGINNGSWEQDFGGRLSFHGFCCYSTNGAKYIAPGNRTGVNAFTAKAVTEALENDQRNNQLSVLSVHWGDEYSQLPNEQQVDFMVELSKRYKFILHGHHAHVMQGIQFVNSSLLAYNQGNFCFDECVSPINPALVIKQSEQNKESYILSVNIENQAVVSWDTTGIYYDKDGIKLIDNSQKLKGLSDKIWDCRSDAYKRESLDMIRLQKQNNLAVHNGKWLLSKLNYYSVGAKLLSYRNQMLYRRALK